MRKHCGFAVLVYASGGNYMAFVEYFLCEKGVKTVFSVCLLLDFDKPFLMHENPRHLLRITEEDNKYAGVPVDCILELIIYLSGNSNHICVARAPNFCGHCR